MKNDFHDIRLLAGFEIEPESIRSRMLSRAEAEQLASALAADLVRTTPDVEQALMVAGGTVLEPAELLRLDLPVWASLADLAAPVLRTHGAQAQVLAIGAHGGRMPDLRLTAPPRPPDGRFVGIPLLLAVPVADGPGMEQHLESELFEQGGIAPPARALLEQFTGAESVHGQLLTVNDLLALQHVQMDVAGLSAFWSVIEEVLLAPDRDASFHLPANLVARWHSDPRHLDIQFAIFDRFEQAAQHYPLWQRAYRSLTGLADAHGLKWQVNFDPDLVHDMDAQVLIHEAGSTHARNAITEQSDPGLGLIAWTVADEGRLRHIYPLSASAVANPPERWVPHAERVNRPLRLCFGGDPPRLQPA